MQCSIKGVVIKEITCHRDDRGWLIELFRHDELTEDHYPMMSYVSMTRPGYIRGPHEHVEQTDLFCFIGLSTFRLYLWDNRPDSATYKEFCHIDLGVNQHALILVPPRIVHAYKNIGDVMGIVYNAPNRLYAGEGKNQPVDEIRHEDDPDSPFTITD